MVAAAFLFYRYAFVAPVSVPRRAVATVYDHTIKAEYGKAIMVAGVIDGDTIELINGERLRYIGIDTPEAVDPRKPIQCFAKEAAEANKNLVEGKSIIFYKDVSNRDQYGRRLGYVYLEDGTFVNLELVRRGFAFSYSYPPDISKAGEFKAAEAQARKNNAGLWSVCAVHQDAAGREQTNGL